ncbi:YD repeat-containing protein [Chitinophaga filiformis]|uniref:RHS repeat domain-containing protein n=1 Tax=Chitinophaga filiformis TaxID=104663 RepID=UPI001F4166BD|nr:RHS repeat domain-containing protein [Chitinophaga filiformis]MCF6403124.1 YD repeat-containing protein [Chitinophaga filiformis]
MRKLFISCLLLAIGTHAFSQVTNNLNPQLDNPVPPSPNAAAFTKFGNIPVGPATGIPQVSVPVYEYSNKNTGLSLAVSLDYHAGGVRVDEVASNVGLGWALNAGGVVSRVVKGTPDEDYDGFLNTPYFDGATGNNPANAPSYKPFVKAYNRQLDIEQDLFTFNFNGRSGRFVYGRNGDILMLDALKAKIEKEVTTLSNGESRITKFTITDENGIKYIFSAYERTWLPGVSFHSQFNSSWFLTAIYAPSGQDSITLEYDDVQINAYTTSVTETEVADLYPSTSNTVMDTYSGHDQAVFGKKLRKISLPQGLNIQFIYSATPRTDLLNDYLLSRILIQDPNKQLGRGYNLQQDYSLGNRATLLKVIPFAGLNAEVQDAPYQFFYKGGLPPRLDNHQDHWGYPTFWVLSENERRIPHEIFAQNVGGEFELPGVNRDTDSSGCQAGSLYKIIYPTGGWTEFQLEPNQAYDGWLDKSFSVVVNDPPYLDKMQSFSLSMNNGTPSFQDTYFTFNGEPESTEFTLSLQPSGIGQICNGSCALRIEMFSPAGSLLASRDFTSPLTQSSITFSVPNLVKGTQYRIRFYYNMLQVSNYSAVAQLKWREKQSQTSHTVTYSHKQPFVGGLRAKRILDYDGISTSPAMVREYEYKGDDSLSSGVLATYPTYTYTTRYEGLLNVSISNGATYVGGPPLIRLRQSSSAYDIIYTAGSPVAYKRTVEYFRNGNKSNGKIERFFTFPSRGSNGSFPFVPASNATWLYGSVQKEVVYDGSDNIVKTTVNAYTDKLMLDYSNQATLNNFTSYTIAPVLYNVPDDYNDTYTSVKVSGYPAIGFLYNYYLPIAGRRDLASTSVTERDPVSGQTMTTVNTYEYDPDFYYLKKHRFTNSKEQEVMEVYTYPADKVVAGQTDPYQDMVTRNMINPVIETELQVSQVKQRKLSTNYKKNWPDNALAILPQTVQTQFQNTPAEIRLRYDAYDSKGNPKSAGQENGMLTCYIWGYNRQFPIAEIKNADYTIVESVLGGAAAVSSFGNQVSPTDVAIKTFLAPLRSDARLNKALITTYSYSPLYGISTITDPSGKTNTYEYDGFGRLKVIRDQNGNILKQIGYQYQAPLTK